MQQTNIYYLCLIYKRAAYALLTAHIGFWKGNSSSLFIRLRLT